MSVQAVNLLLGTGYLYAKRTTDADGKYRLIGSIKGSAEFLYKPTFVEQRPSDVIVQVRRDKIEEMASLKVTICDFKMDQMIKALGRSLSTTSISKTVSVRIAEEFLASELLSITSSVTLSHTAKSTTSVHVTSLDRLTNYVPATDYTMITTKVLMPKAALKGKPARVYYTAIHANGGKIQIGDSEFLQQMSIMYVHKQSNGKHIAIKFPIATIKGDLKLDFKEKDYTMPEITFEALGDPTASKGMKLFSIVREP
jgi:hypothetical protein